MKLLAFETATEACSVALLLDGEVTEEYQLAPRAHAELILPMADRLLATAGLRPADLSAVAFGRGPGAFTGLRIAAGVAQGIAFAVDLPVVPVSSLAALAQGAVGEGLGSRILAAVDARMGEVYWGAFTTVSGLVEPSDEERVVAPDKIPTPEGEGWIGVGSGWATYGDTLCARLGAAVGERFPDRYPHARDVARLAARDFAAGVRVPAEQALPIYLRDQVVHP